MLHDNNAIISIDYANIVIYEDIGPECLSENKLSLLDRLATPS